MTFHFRSNCRSLKAHFWRFFAFFENVKFANLKYRFSVDFEDFWGFEKNAIFDSWLRKTSFNSPMLFSVFGGIFGSKKSPMEHRGPRCFWKMALRIKKDFSNWKILIGFRKILLCFQGELSLLLLLHLGVFWKKCTFFKIGIFEFFRKGTGLR